MLNCLAFPNVNRCPQIFALYRFERGFWVATFRATPVAKIQLSQFSIYTPIATFRLNIPLNVQFSRPFNERPTACTLHKLTEYLILDVHLMCLDAHLTGV